jgi:DNA-binding response OmpR family regulator
MSASLHPLVVVADDDPLLRAVLEHKLVAAGYRVAQAGNGQEALDLSSSQSPAAMVLDAMMPFMDGFETLRRMKAGPETRECAVIMLTALKRDEDVVTALQLGAADYLAKPFNPDELVLRLKRLVPIGTGRA